MSMKRIRNLVLMTVMALTLISSGIVIGLKAQSSFAATKPEPPVELFATESSVGASLIGEERAKEIALKDAGVSADSVSYIWAHLDWDDGVADYDVEFYKDGVEYDYEVGAINGSILDQSMERKEAPRKKKKTSANAEAGAAAGTGAVDTAVDDGWATEAAPDNTGGGGSNDTAADDGWATEAVPDNTGGGGSNDTVAEDGWATERSDAYYDDDYYEGDYDYDDRYDDDYYDDDYDDRYDDYDDHYDDDRYDDDYDDDYDD